MDLELPNGDVEIYTEDSGLTSQEEQIRQAIENVQEEKRLTKKLALIKAQKARRDERR